MRQKKVWRYYCDHCKKSGCGKAAIVRHEAHCVRNPNRACRMCEHVDDGEDRKPVADLVAVIENTLDVVKLREAARGCPACMLAASVTFNGEHKDWDPEEGPPFWFDYNAEHDSFWSEIRALEYE